jgi:hypothetical protein
MYSCINFFKQEEFKTVWPELEYEKGVYRLGDHYFNIYYCKGTPPFQMLVGVSVLHENKKLYTPIDANKKHILFVGREECYEKMNSACNGLFIKGTLITGVYQVRVLHEIQNNPYMEEWTCNKGIWDLEKKKVGFYTRGRSYPIRICLTRF